MGMLWSMKAASGQKKGLRLVKRDITQPIVVDVFLLRGHVEVAGKKDVDKDGDIILSKTTVYRRYLAKGVTAFNVNAGGVKGMLFVPSGEQMHHGYYLFVDFLLGNLLRRFCLQL